jgi:hypothetical protein
VTFGWEGFSFDHPEDWAPVALSGNRDQGYARVASPGRVILQIRWRRMRRPADATAFLDAYLGRLSRDAKKAKVAFHADRETEDGRTSYRYSGLAYGRGVLFQPPVDGRAFVLEAASTKNDSLQSLLREALGSFRVESSNDRWSAFGLDLVLPKGLAIERKEFLAGKTRLFMKAKGVKLSAERWGFADQLLARHGLEPWARAILDAERATVSEEDEGLRIDVRGGIGRPGSQSIVRPQLERNQIVVVRSTARDPRWRPQWDWVK